LVIREQQQVVEIYIPSELGYEKIVLALVASAAKKIGFSPEKIEDLKTAIAEACTNAIEHGNSLDAQRKVLVKLVAKDNCIQVSVIDEGYQAIPNRPPDRSSRTDFRGLGLFLMQKLVDKVEIKSQPGRNEVQLTSYYPSPQLPL
jgi:serine/threonine-protein kinase RsbW